MKYEPVEYGYQVWNECSIEHFHCLEDALEEVKELCAYDDYVCELIDDEYGSVDIAGREYSTSEILYDLNNEWFYELGSDLIYNHVESLYDDVVGVSYHIWEDYYMKKYIKITDAYFVDITDCDWEHISKLREQDSYTIRDALGVPYFIVRRNGKLMGVKA